jgi:hypothetical protein
MGIEPTYGAWEARCYLKQLNGSDAKLASSDAFGFKALHCGLKTSWGGLCPLCAAGSTDRRNTGVKSICWCLERQGLAGPSVELAGHFVQMCLGVDRQVCPLGEVLPQ